MIWILDASVAIKWFLLDERHPNAEIVLKRVISNPRYFAVPELFCFELFSVLCRLHKDPLNTYINGVIPIIQSGILRAPLTERMIEYASRFVELGLTGYDACYAALAKELNGIWLTFDEKAHKIIAKSKISAFIDSALPSGF